MSDFDFNIDLNQLNSQELALFDIQALERLKQLLEEQSNRIKFNRLDTYDPYWWQKKFHADGSWAAQRLLMAGNRTGKTYSGADEMAYHLTGRYPDWWEGRRFERPISAWAAGVSNAKTRDIIQLETLGDPDDPSQLGTGTIPLDCIVSTVRLPGVPNAFQSVLVKHYTDGVYDGNSRLGFLSYEMGEEKFMGSSLDVIWLDEQPIQKIFTQCITRTADTGGMVYMTFTPEKGMTEVVNNFMNNIKPGQSLTQATWDDCPHLTEAVKEQLLAVYSPHERDMRTKGIPIFGSGMVFPIPDEMIECEPFEIPRHWPRISAIDFGWDHPTAFVFMAMDPADGTKYVYAAWKKNKTLPAIHAISVRDVDMGVGDTIPMAWPHDGNQHDKGSGAALADQYREEGMNMLPFCFTNPPAPGEAEGSGGRSVEVGLFAMHTAMEGGKLKVFNTLRDWFMEKQMYHREDGKVVPASDDIMSATRYAFQSTRFALPLTNTGYTMSGKLNLPNVEVC